MSVPAEWSEDELYGRYELRLRSDFGGFAAAMAAWKKIQDTIKSSDAAMGYELEIVQLVGSERKRRKDWA